MKTLPLILGFVAAGVVGALTATIMQKDGTDAAAPAPGVDPRVQELVVAVERLRLDVADLKATPPVVVNAPALAATEGPAAIPGLEVADVDAAPAPDEKKFQESVDKAVADARKKEMEAIGQMWSSRAAQREKDVVAQFAKDQGLSDYQRDEMGKILATRREKLGPFYRAMFTPPAGGETRDFAKIQKDMEKVRVAADEELKTLLGTDQLDAFKKLEDSRRGRWGMGGGRSSSSPQDDDDR